MVLGLIIAAIVVVILILIVILTYNGLISKRNRVQDASAQIDVQLKRRYDLIPNLVSTVKGYMKYEKQVLTKVTSLRSSIVNGTMEDKAQANNQLSQALKTIFAVAENYPDLKASENFKKLQDELENTEDRISYVRTSYNDYVLDYNNAIMTFPGSSFANWFHFQKADFFQAPDEEKQVVKVDFSDVNSEQSVPSASTSKTASTPAKAKKTASKGAKKKKQQ
ncbi:MAG: LemA family protein [Candidatus Micrarchaeaceae archaeon]|jgi:LemA protein